MSLGLIGPHILYGYSGRLGTPRAVKVVEPSVAYVRQIRRETHPRTLIIARWDERMVLDEDGAREWVDRHLDDMRAMTDWGRDQQVLFELGNEPDTTQMEALTRYTLTALVLMHDRGLRAGIGSFSMGTPEFQEWGAFLPAVEAMEEGDRLCLHEYVKDEQDLNNVWHLGRFSLIAALHNVPIIISEFGKDVTEIGGKAGYEGWSDDRLMAFFEAANWVYQGYSQVEAMLPFTIGHTDFGWDAFDLNGVWPRLVAAQGDVEPEMIVVLDPDAWEPTLPVPGARVSQHFGERPEVYAGGHPGVDLAPPTGVQHRDWYGTPVLATVAGEAYALGDQRTGYGLHVYTFGEREDELLAHLCQHAFSGKRDIEVGEVVGWTGHTGRCEPEGVLGTHLHWGIRPKPYQWGNGHRGYVDPLEYE